MSFSKIYRLVYIEKEKLFSLFWNFSNLNVPTFFVKEKIKVELQEFLHLANSWHIRLITIYTSRNKACHYYLTKFILYYLHFKFRILLTHPKVTFVHTQLQSIVSGYHWCYPGLSRKHSWTLFCRCFNLVFIFWSVLFVCVHFHVLIFIF